MNYEKDITIDESALDVEWLNQPTLAIKWGRHWSQCKKELAQAEEEIKVIRSELVKEANEDPDKYLGKGVKPTNPNVEAYYRTHKNHRECKQKIIDLQFELDNADVAKWEFSTSRKSALENLVKLHGQQYFAGPSVPRDLSKEWEEKQRQDASNQKVRIGRRK